MHGSLLIYLFNEYYQTDLFNEFLKDLGYSESGRLSVRKRAKVDFDKAFLGLLRRAAKRDLLPEQLRSYLKSLIESAEMTSSQRLKLLNEKVIIGSSLRVPLFTFGLIEYSNPSWTEWRRSRSLETLLQSYSTSPFSDIKKDTPNWDSPVVMIELIIGLIVAMELDINYVYEGEFANSNGLITLLLPLKLDQHIDLKAYFFETLSVWTRHENQNQLLEAMATRMDDTQSDPKKTLEKRLERWSKGDQEPRLSTINHMFKLISDDKNKRLAFHMLFVIFNLVDLLGEIIIGEDDAEWQEIESIKESSERWRSALLEAWPISWF